MELNKLWDKVYNLQDKAKECERLADKALEEHDDYNYAYYSGFATAYGDAAMEIAGALPTR